jgi:PEP-CTERM motif
MRLSLRSISTISLAAFITLAAHADTFTFQASGAGITSSGTIVAVADPTLANAFDVTSISGTFNGTAITSLLPCPAYDPNNQCNNANPRNFSFDNLIYIASGQPFLDGGGLGFGVGASGYQVNFFFDTSTPPGNYAIFDNTNFTEPLSSFTVALATIPEPGSLILFGSGLLGVFGAMRRRFQS